MCGCVGLEELIDVYIGGCNVHRIVLSSAKIREIRIERLGNLVLESKNNVDECVLLGCSSTLFFDSNSGSGSGSNLRSLKLYNCNDITNFNEFGCIRELRELYIDGCANIRNLHGLDSSFLKKMMVTDCALFDIGCISNIDLEYFNGNLFYVDNIVVKKLKKITLHGRQNHNPKDTCDMSIFVGICNNEIIILFNINVINIEYLKDLEKLQYVYFGEGCDVSSKDVEELRDRVCVVLDLSLSIK